MSLRPQNDRREAPYAPLEAMRAGIRVVTESRTAAAWDADRMSRVDGISTSIAPRVVQGLRLLRLLDRDGMPTPALDRYRRHPIRSAALAELLTSPKGVYAPVFERFDLSAADPEAVFAFFHNTYKPVSMTDRMVRLFYGLAHDAGLSPRVPRVMGLPARRREVGRHELVHREDPMAIPDVLRALSHEHGPGSSAQSSSSEGFRKVAVVPTLTEGHVARLPPVVAALIAQLPNHGEKWTSEDFDWWLSMMKLAAPREYGFVRQAQEGQHGRT